MATITLSTLLQRLAQNIGDFLEEDTTTLPTTHTYFYSTNLNKWDRGRNDYFNDWYAYLTEGTNSGVERLIQDYGTTAGKVTLRGAALTADPSQETFWVSRYSRTEKLRALNEAMRQTYPILYDPREDRSLVAGNILPDNSFEDWSSTSALIWYTNNSSATLARTSTAGLYRGWRGSYSAKITAGADNAYFGISSTAYPRLLDLMGQTVTFKAWAYPEVADNATLVIYTLKADGTAQTLTSTTACPAGKWTLLELEDQTLNDDLVQVDFRFKVGTNTKYVYFDSARVSGINVYDHILPARFKDGDIWQVYVQDTGFAEDPCDDLHPQNWTRVFDYDVYHDGTYKFLKFRNLFVDRRQIRLIGASPFTDLSSDTDTIELDAEQASLLLSYAAHLLFDMQKGVVSAEHQGEFDKQSGYWYSKYVSLKSQLRRVKPSQTLKVREY